MVFKVNKGRKSLWPLSHTWSRIEKTLFSLVKKSIVLLPVRSNRYIHYYKLWYHLAKNQLRIATSHSLWVMRSVSPHQCISSCFRSFIWGHYMASTRLLTEITVSMAYWGLSRVLLGLITRQTGKHMITD